MSMAVLLVVGLAAILVGASLFTNAIEWFGKRLRLSEGMVGSVLAAVGTALPETMVPLVAILAGNGDYHSREGIGVGAILGAPFMLATLAMFVTGTAALVFRRRRRRGSLVVTDPDVMQRDLGFFLIAYPTALAASLFAPGPGRNLIALALVAGYVYYVFGTLRSGKNMEDHEVGPLHLSRVLSDRGTAGPNLPPIVLQLMLSLVAIIGGAHFFVEGLMHTADVLGVPPLLLSLVLTPVATELPEKFNSVLWIREGKDTLALGNITGAMAFQGSVIPAVGITLTSWHLDRVAMASAVPALLAAGFYYAIAREREGLRSGSLVLGGVFYAAYLAYMAAFRF